MLFSILIGTGVEFLIYIVLGLLFFSIVGKYATGFFVVIQPSFSIINGMTTSRLYLLFNGSDWHFLIVLSAAVAPIFVFCTFAIIDELEPGLI